MTNKQKARHARAVQKAWEGRDDVELQFAFDHLGDSDFRRVKSGKRKGQLKLFWCKVGDDILAELRRRRIARAIDMEAAAWAKFFNVTSEEHIEGRRRHQRANVAVGFFDGIEEFMA